MNPDAPRNEIQRLIYATRNSLKGYARVFQDEAAFRTQTMLLLVLIPVALWLGRSWAEFALLVASWALVLAAELGNSAIEAVVDRVSRAEHDLAGKAKDAGSAMVMTAMLIAGLVWLAVIFDRFG